MKLKWKVRDWITLISLGVGTAVLYFWNLTANGYANSFYSAAVQAGSVSWKAFFYGSFDSSNAITVDKPPASLWLMELSARIFGLSSFSILLPEVLMGIASVLLLFVIVRKRFGWLGGFTAGLTLALTPVAALMFRFNNPDAMLALLMILAAGATFRLNDTKHGRWAIVIGAILGLAFLVKSFQAFLILPALAIPYLLFGRPKLGRRLLHLLAATISMVIAGGWWLVIVELTPASERPYIGGSQTNSALELILGYNGFGRLTGNETGSVGGGGGNSASMWGETGIFRLFTADFGGQIAWLLPLALVAIALGVIAYWKRRSEDGRFMQVAVWGSALLVTGLTFSFMQGIFHQYYTVALAPYIAVLAGIFAATVYRFRDRLWMRISAAATVLGSSAWAAVLLSRNSEQGWLVPTVVVLGILAAAALLFIYPSARKLVMALAGVLTFTALLAGPTYYTLDTVASAHSGSIVTAGPAVSGGMGGFGGGNRGGMGGQMGEAPAGGPGGQGFPGGTQAGEAPTSLQGAGDGMGGGAGGLLNSSTPSSELVSFLKKNAAGYSWVLAVTGSQQAAGYQLATGDAVMSMGGFNGTDPYPSLAQFEKLVAAGKIHYYIAASSGGMGGSSNSTSSAISEWVSQNFQTVTVGGTTLYDLTAKK